MAITVGVTTFEGHNAGNHTFSHAADTCPICHRHVEPKVISAHMALDGKSIEVIFRCTSQACGHLFIGTYLQTGNGLWLLRNTAPTHAKPVSIPNEVAKISPTFVEIMKQVAVAEASNLDQLVGIGLRKALEFLIKDFACVVRPSDTEKIRVIPLGACINDYVDDTRIKSVASRAAWLGNDETHYVRKWENRDINDLKMLVKLTENWIHSTLLTEQYEKDMKK